MVNKAKFSAAKRPGGRKAKNIPYNLDDQKRMATAASLTSIHENPKLKKRVKKSVANIDPQKQQQLNMVKSEMDAYVNQMNQMLHSGQITQDQYNAEYERIDAMKDQYFKQIMGGSVGTILTSLIPYIPKAIEYGVKGINWIVDKFRKKKHGGMINPFYKIKGVKYAHEVPGELMRLLTGGRIVLKDSGFGGRLYLTSGGGFGEGIKSYGLSTDGDYDDYSDDEDGGTINLDNLSDEVYYGSGLKKVAKLKYLTDMYKQGHGIDREKLRRTHM
jgi:hypothetical protein